MALFLPRPTSSARYCDTAAVTSAHTKPTFDALYAEYFAFAWRSLRRLGVPEAGVEDAVQDLFVVVHRRLRDFEARSSVKTWLFGIALRVASDHRRRIDRKGEPAPLPETLADGARPDPFDSTARAEAARIVDALLDELDDDKRAVFVLAELEELTAREIAETLDLNVNTVSSRLRAAREEFSRALARRRTITAWREQS